MEDVQQHEDDRVDDQESAVPGQDGAEAGLWEKPSIQGEDGEFDSSDGDAV